jgi:hypothetical protein
MKFTLPISPDYVAHWGLWEAVREIYQNALDEQTRDPKRVATIEHDPVNASLRIHSARGRLKTKSLLLGATTKAVDKNQRGKYGEGYKLAALVLGRLKHGVSIRSGVEMWSPQIEYSEQYDANVLTITVENAAESNDGVTFTIFDVKPAQWAKLKKNILDFADKDSDAILLEPYQKGRIYVGGLYVTTLKDYVCGYAFKPGTITLNRDRDMVNDFDVSWETSRLWTRRGGTKCNELLEAEAPDVAHVDSHAYVSSPIVSSYSGYFHSRHGASAYPVSSQEEIEKATRAGFKWVLVPKTVQALLGKLKSYFIPDVASPVAKLRAWRKKWIGHLPEPARIDLDAIIGELDPEHQTEVKVESEL